MGIFDDIMNGFAGNGQPNPLGNFGNALSSIAAKDTAYRNDQHMQKVFAANPAYGAALYGAKNQQDDNETNRALAKLKLQSAISGKDGPAALQLANEYLKAKATGNTERANALEMFAKTNDKGVVLDANGNAVSIPGYGTAVGGIAADKKGMEQQAAKDVDKVMNPLIAGGEADAKNNSDLKYKPKIAVDTANAETNNKKTIAADDTLLVLDKIEAPDENGLTLLDKATGGTGGALLAAGKGVVGVSDASTQANAELSVYGNRLVNNVPRMEGPQSDSDREFYKAQAGKIADPKVPAGDKKAAISAIRQLQEKYATQNSGVDPSVPKTDQGGMAELPPASAHVGRTITDTTTDKKFISNGKEWVPQ